MAARTLPREPPGDRDQEQSNKCPSILLKGTKPYEFLGFGDIHGPKPCEFIGFGDIYGPQPYEFTNVLLAY